jgi:hypothetical protein
MKLGIAYNVFDGTELLQMSLQSIRPEVDFVCAVYQRVSNHGNAIDTNFDFIFSSLGFNSWIPYTPNLNALPSTNEIEKRNIGIQMLQNAGCTHFMTMDCDEVYDINQFKYAKKVILEGDYDSSACQMQTYYKSTSYRFSPPEEYYVPLIYKIDHRRFREPTHWPVVADPTRKLPSGNIKIFKREEIEMHHYSWIRNDIKTKIVNSSAKRNWAGQINEMVLHYENWKPGMKAYCAGQYFDLVKV